VRRGGGAPSQPRSGAGARSGRRAALGVCALLAVAGCADALLSPEPGDAPPEVARAFWSEVDQYYSFFDVKGVDWSALGDEYLPRVTSSTSDQQLFNTLSVMLSKLRDGHATLDAPGMHYAYDGWYMAYPQNYDPSFVDGYLSAPRGSAAGSAVTWGRLGDHLGYLRISTLGRDGIGDGVDQALAAFGDSLSGLVIDVRSNGGGSDAQGDAAAGRFTRQRVLYRTVRYKTGPAHDDFGPPIEGWIEPAGARPYSGPVVVLTNRGVFSAAEDFVLAMRVLPQVTVVGDTTGGGSGNPIPRELPNGWNVHVPRWRVWGADGTFFEGVGLAPDIPVQITDADRARAHDTILERAIEVITEGGAGAG
jgi:Peptidase family S41/Tricorn protease C1 domain